MWHGAKSSRKYYSNYTYLSVFNFSLFSSFCHSFNFSGGLKSLLISFIVHSKPFFIIQHHTLCTKIRLFLLSRSSEGHSILSCSMIKWQAGERRLTRISSAISVCDETKEIDNTKMLMIRNITKITQIMLINQQSTWWRILLKKTHIHTQTD